MRNAIILHGMTDPGLAEYYNPHLPAASNAHWLPWLQKQLLIHDISAQTPEIPHSWKPDYRTWRIEFERYDIRGDTLLVGHSCGGGFLVRWLSQHPTVKVGKVVLVAPWLDPSREHTLDFFDFIIDSQLVFRTDGCTIFHSDNDSPGVQASVERLRQIIPACTFREFHNYGHFCFSDMHTVEFPELIAELCPTGGTTHA